MRRETKEKQKKMRKMIKNIFKYTIIFLVIIFIPKFISLFYYKVYIEPNCLQSFSYNTEKMVCLREKKQREET